jgi:hypothetical protein
MAKEPRSPRGPDKRQDDLQDERHGTYDPIANVVLPDSTQQTQHERAQPGADVRGKSVPGEKLPMEEYWLPEGLKREPKGPLNKSTGRGETPKHVPGAKRYPG